MTRKQKIEAENAVRSLEASADTIMLIDGDRNHMNRSDMLRTNTDCGAAHARSCRLAENYFYLITRIPP